MSVPPRGVDPRTGNRQASPLAVAALRASVEMTVCGGCAPQDDNYEDSESEGGPQAQVPSFLFESLLLFLLDVKIQKIDLGSMACVCLVSDQ